ncbi:hypothetical protein H4Q26_005253 [Puccinia striiformis f. sp. tritici PST-130]|nr:hypothetical protein H4Q26_005253 [Puccinia striiformis f. sp. tritici PST-130]
MSLANQHSPLVAPAQPLGPRLALDHASKPEEDLTLHLIDLEGKGKPEEQAYVAPELTRYFSWPLVLIWSARLRFIETLDVVTRTRYANHDGKYTLGYRHTQRMGAEVYLLDRG